LVEFRFHGTTWKKWRYKMISKRKQPVRRLKGQGEVYLGENRLAAVDYDLRIERELVFVRSYTNIRNLPIQGEITVVEGERDLYFNSRGPFTLHLEDDRKWEFHVEHGTPTSPTYQVVGGELIDSQD
jgi:hypothetical protein